MKLTWTRNTRDQLVPQLHHEPYIGPVFKDSREFSDSGIRKPEYEFKIKPEHQATPFEHLIKMPEYRPPNG